MTIHNFSHPGTQEYLNAFQRGEERGFTYFFKLLYTPLVLYANRLLNDRAAAEDVVEESFIKIWERHSGFTHGAVIRSWLYTTVRNASLTRLQKEVKANSNRAHLQLQSEGAHEDSVLHDIVRAEVISEVHRHIATLPPACRKIFELLYIEGKTVREVAEVLDLSISTVKNQKARGLELLRSRFPDIGVWLLLCVLWRQ